MKIFLKSKFFKINCEENIYKELQRNKYNVYTLSILSILNRAVEEIALSPLDIYRMFNKRGQPTRNDIKQIKNSIETLSQMNIISYEIFDKKYIISINDLNVIETNPKSEYYEPFFVLETDLLYNMMKEKDGIDLIQHYILLISTINNKSEYGFTSQKKFSQVTGISRNTISKYRKRLEEIEILKFESMSDEELKSLNIIIDKEKNKDFTLYKYYMCDYRTKQQEEYERKLAEKNGNEEIPF